MTSIIGRSGFIGQRPAGGTARSRLQTPEAACRAGMVLLVTIVCVAVDGG